MLTNLYKIKLPKNLSNIENIFFIPFSQLLPKEFREKKSIEIPPGVGRLIRLSENSAIVYDTFSGQKAFFLASLFYASGTENIFFMGTAGTIAKKITAGTISIPEPVYFNDTISGINTDKVFKLNSNSYKILNSICPKNKKSSLISVYSPIIEDELFINTMKKNKINLVEMEIAQLIIASEIYNKNIYPFVLISDLIEPNNWVTYYNLKEFKEQKQLLFNKIINYIF